MEVAADHIESGMNCEYEWKRWGNEFRSVLCPGIDEWQMSKSAHAAACTQWLKEQQNTTTKKTHVVKFPRDSIVLEYDDMDHDSKTQAYATFSASGESV